MIRKSIVSFAAFFVMVVGLSAGGPGAAATGLDFDYGLLEVPGCENCGPVVTLTGPILPDGTPAPQGTALANLVGLITVNSKTISDIKNGQCASEVPAFVEEECKFTVKLEFSYIGPNRMELVLTDGTVVVLAAAGVTTYVIKLRHQGVCHTVLPYTFKMRFCTAVSGSSCTSWTAWSEYKYYLGCNACGETEVPDVP